MSEFYNVNVSDEPANYVNILDGVTNRVEVTEEQANIIRVATQGLQGPPGTQIIDGTGAPSNSIGRIGDFFIDRSARNLYGPKTASGWGDAVFFGGAQFLYELDDVTLNPSVEDQNVLMWDDAVSQWVDQRIRYVHTQGVPSAVWNVPHGLKTKPSGVSVFDNAGLQVIGEITHVDDNNLVITFTSALSGKAYLG